MSRMLVGLVIFALEAAGGAEASQSGLDLLRACEGRAGTNELATKVGEIYCAGYVAGFVDAYQLVAGVPASQTAVCLPAGGLENEQYMLVVGKWLREHPNDLHKTARVSVFLALKEAFPCRGR